MAESRQINKILEIDLDTERTGEDAMLKVFQLATISRPRSRQPDETYDLKDNMAILTLALSGAILAAEQEGEYPIGGGIRKAFDKLGEYYADARQKLVTDISAPQGISLSSYSVPAPTVSTGRPMDQPFTSRELDAFTPQQQNIYVNLERALDDPSMNREQKIAYLFNYIQSL